MEQTLKDKMNSKSGWKSSISLRKIDMKKAQIAFRTLDPSKSNSHLFKHKIFKQFLKLKMHWSKKLAF